MTIYILLFILSKLISWVGLAKIFQKAGIPSWKAFVPFLNWAEWLKLIGKPKWWILLLFIPIVNVFYGAYMLIGLAKSFKHYSFGHHAAAVLGYFFYLPFLGFSKSEKYYGPDGLRPGEFHPEYSTTRSWADSIIFAIVAAHLIRMFFIEAYKIPTSSMEPTLQIGDFMFVSKMHYGSRVPMTPLSLPLIHHSIPRTQKRAYSEAIKLPYFRFPALQKIKRNDIAVFNVPFEHNMQSEMVKRYYRGIDYKSRPVDKREHYIKRVIGLPGDQLEIKDNQVYINGSIGKNPELVQFNYQVVTTKPLTKTEWRQEGVRAYNNYFNGSQNPTLIGKNTYNLATTPKIAEELKAKKFVKEITLIRLSSEIPSHIADFPKDANKKGWTIENYGAISIPQKGMTIELTKENAWIYKEAIEVHEGNQLELIQGKFFINGEETNKYTFKMDYYWLMGDNRHNSLDSRAWGFVPEDHIVGKPLFIFFSSQGGQDNPGIRWNRILKKAQDMN